MSLAAKTLAGLQVRFYTNGCSSRYMRLYDQAVVRVARTFLIQSSCCLKNR